MKNICISYKNQYLSWTLITFLIIYQLVRLIVFIDTYGGFEHDSGWMLGISRSLVESGSYTTMVSTMANLKPGGGLNVYNKYRVQNEAGQIYFFPESIGPSSVIPNAIIIKLFGAGFWQYRAGPLLFFIILILLASYLLYRADGLLPILITHLFLFFYPRLIIFLGYEALGEMPALAYMLLAIALYLKGVEAETKRAYWFGASGLAASLALTSKLIALLPLVGLGVLWLVLYFKKKTTIKDLIALTAGGLFFLVLWNLYQLIVLTRLFGFDVYAQHTQQRFDVFLTNGSGIAEQAVWSIELFLYKLLLVSAVSHPNQIISFITLVTIAVSGPFLIWQFRQSRFSQNLVIFLWSGWLVHTAWFVIASENAWIRHYWFALILAVLLLSLLWSNLLQKLKAPSTWPYRLAAVILTCLICLNFYNQYQAATLFVSDTLVEKWYQQHLATNHSRIPASLVPRQAQQDAVDFIATLPTSSHIFYPERHKSAEMGVLTGRILYPIQRRLLMPPNKGDVVLIGPSLFSPWRKPTEAAITQTDRDEFVQGVMEQILRECPNIIFENDYYIICSVTG